MLITEYSIYEESRKHGEGIGGSMRRLQGASSLLCLLEPKVIIVQGYSSPNTTILSGVYNLSTTCFGQCCCGHHQVGYNLSDKLYRYDITQNYY